MIFVTRRRAAALAAVAVTGSDYRERETISAQAALTDDERRRLVGRREAFAFDDGSRSRRR
jgi:hypothetical protein